MFGRTSVTLSLLFVACSLLLVGCVSDLSKRGSSVRLVTAHQKEDCEFIDVVTAHSGFGWNAGHNTEGVINELRNEVAQLGGNALYIMDSDTAGMFSNQVAGSGEALRCVFK